MNLEKAIDILENVIADEVIGTYCLEIQKEVECSKNCENEDCFLQQAIDTVLKELNTLQMNYKLLEEKFDGSAEEKVDDLTNRLIANTRTIKIKDEYLKLLNDMLIDYDGWHTAESLKELIDETRDYIHKALNNDDKSAIYSAGNYKSSNILGEVIE